MRFDSVAWGIFKRKVLAWLRLKFGPKPMPIPKIIIPRQHWSNSDRQREEESYAANPTAFWLRPDRGSHEMPCWMIVPDYAPRGQTSRSVEISQGKPNKPRAEMRTAISRNCNSAITGWTIENTPEGGLNQSMTIRQLLPGEKVMFDDGDFWLQRRPIPELIFPYS